MWPGSLNHGIVFSGIQEVLVDHRKVLPDNNFGAFQLPPILDETIPSIVTGEFHDDGPSLDGFFMTTSVDSVEVVRVKWVPQVVAGDFTHDTVSIFVLFFLDTKYSEAVSTGILFKLIYLL